VETDPADQLIQRIRERAADPAGRTEERPSEFWRSVTSQSLGGLLGMGRSIAQDLGRLLRQGPDDVLTARAEEIEHSMTTPAERPLPAPASEEQLADAERRLGFALPPLLRRLYAEVANGGFGPGPGILGVKGGQRNDHGKTVEDLHAEMLEAVQENRRWVWPAGLLPVVDQSGVYVCVDATAPYRIVEFDFEELDEEGRDGGWSRAFSDASPSFEDWLAAWLARPTATEREAARQGELKATMTSVPEVTRAYWLSMTPEQRAAHGLPEKGWGRALFGDAWGDDPRDGSGGS
jgi:SMI1 / KNR4 family (SUKH-1)